MIEKEPIYFESFGVLQKIQNATNKKNVAITLELTMSECDHGFICIPLFQVQKVSILPCSNSGCT